MNQKQKLLFLGILTLAALLRFYRLGEVPAGVNRDEASMGYTAYSILKTGRDEYGRFLPFSFESFGDWKLPLYIYLTVLPVGMMGLSDISVRLVSALAGVAAVAVVFFLADEIVRNKKVSLASMFFLAVSPWHLHFSRVGYEANLALFLTISGVFLILRGLKKTHWCLPAGFFLLALTYYTYHGSHVFTTLLGFVFLMLFRKDLIIHQYGKLSLAIFLASSFFIMAQTVFSANLIKISGSGILSDPAVIHGQIETKRNQHDNPDDLRVRIVHNRPVFFLTRFLENYLSSFSPAFLFFRGGGNPTHNIDGLGNLYPVEAVFLIAGMFSLTAVKNEKMKNLIFFWLLLAPVASAITKDAPHTARLVFLLPALAMTAGMGIREIIRRLSSRHLLPKTLILISLAVIYLFNIFFYLDNYYTHFLISRGEYWGAGYKKLAELIKGGALDQKTIVISHPERSPYIFMLFYTLYDPNLYQAQAVRYPATPDQFRHVAGFSRFEFRDIDWNRDYKKENTAVIAGYADLPFDLREGKTNFYRLDNSQNPLVLFSTYD